MLIIRKHEGTSIANEGVYTTLQESLALATKQLEELKSLPKLSEGCHTQLKFYIKDGFDGAGNQLKIKGCKGATMELFGYVILRVEDVTVPVSSSHV